MLIGICAFFFLMKKIILLDVDGVLCNVDSVCNFGVVCRNSRVFGVNTASEAWTTSWAMEDSIGMTDNKHTSDSVQ